jgi:hypothetical protein
MRCIIVADGPSANGFMPPDGVPVIAVKRAIRWLPRADYWFSLDPNAASLELMRDRRPGVAYYCACNDDTKLPEGVTRMRRIVGHGTEPMPRNSPAWWFWRWACVPGLCEEPGAIHTGNSAWGALGLAYHLGFRYVLLVGVDGTQDRRLSDGKAPHNLSHLPMLFETARRQVDLQTVGHLGGITHTSLTDWLEETA